VKLNKTSIPHAENSPFDNSTNGFTADTVQEAIEEVGFNVEGFPRAGIRSTANGTVSNNQWIGPTELLPNTPTLVAPVSLKINEITWANQNTNVSFRLDFRLNSKTGTIFYQLNVSSPNSGYGYVTGVDYTLNAGDAIYVQYIDLGTNASDFDLVVWISRVS